MQNSKLFLILFLFGFNSFAGEVNFSGYFRAPVGSNLEGGKQIQLTNPGSFGNEFRLNNELGYGELNFGGTIIKPANGSKAAMDANFTLGISPPGNSQYADITPTAGTMQIIQGYLIGNFDSDARYWIGKRFNRWGYALMDDFFYFADMSGNGAGVEHITTANGEWAFAVLQYVDTSIEGTTGNPAKEAIEARWKGVQIFSDDKANNFDFWLAYAATSPGKGTQNPSSTTPTAVDYAAGRGGAFGVRWNYGVAGGTNELSAQVGTGVMQSLLLNNTAAVLNADENKKTRYRLVENYNQDISERWSLRTVLVHDLMQFKDGTGNKEQWSSLGVRPGFNVNDHLQLILEAGYSTVTRDSENAGARTLTRVTVGPQWGVTRGLNMNPMFRAMVSYTSWNDANGDTANAGSLASVVGSANAGMLKDKKSLVQFGFEAEMGF